jgi:hypothetical protein
MKRVHDSKGNIIDCTGGVSATSGCASRHYGEAMSYMLQHEITHAARVHEFHIGEKRLEECSLTSQIRQASQLHFESL